MTATDELRRMLDERGVEWTATDKLRRMLDERGVEWWPMHDIENGYHQDRDTEFVIDGKKYTAHEWGGTLNVYGLTPEQAIEATLGTPVTGETSDGYHTFNELYHHRAVLFSVIVRDHIDRAWKSKAHHDGTMYDGMFIVGIETPQGQATYHYDIDPYWDMFDCQELGRAPEWDGHTPDDAIERIATLGAGTCHNASYRLDESRFHCSECESGGWWKDVADGRDKVPRYCPNCGKAVKR